MSVDAPDGGRLTSEGLRLGVVCARYNGELTDALLARVTTLIEDAGPPERLAVERVPGSHEVPVAMALMLESDSFDCLVGLGIVIKGATSHHHLVAENAGILFIRGKAISGVPIINGIIVTNDPDEARERITGPIDRGREFAKAALHMAALKRKWTTNSN